VKHVLVLCEFATRSGGENSLLTLLPRLAADCRITVAAPADGPLVVALGELGIDHVCWDVRDTQGDRLPNQQVEQALLKLVSATGPDIVHANSLSMSRVLGRVRAQLPCASIGHLRDMLNLSNKALSDIACLDRVLAVSHATREWFIERGLPAERVVTVYNGVDLERFTPGIPDGSLAAELELPEESLLLGAIGQIVQRKGWSQLLTAVASCFSRHPGPQLVIVGDRWSGKQEAVEYEQQLLQQANRPPLANRVHWLGYRHDVAQLLPQFSVLVHAARQEPLGRVLLESAACGVPVIATECGGTREIFPAQSDGAVLVEVDNESQLAEAIGRLLSDPELRQQLGRAGRSNAESRFSADQAARILLENYQGLEIKA
jgi:glycosyltransferase involved in cell wall biosynthesis